MTKINDCPGESAKIESQSRVHPAHMREQFDKIAALRHHDPFTVLGRHPCGSLEIVRVFLPDAVRVTLQDIGAVMTRVHEAGIFTWQGDGTRLPSHFRVSWVDSEGREHTAIDPYSFGRVTDESDLAAFNEGRHVKAHRFLGARVHAIDDIEGVLFSVWAPNAQGVSVVGDFNGWDGRHHQMRVLGTSGVWELFLPQVSPGLLYKFEIRPSGRRLIKADPYARASEHPPGTASRITPAESFEWQDNDYMAARASRDWLSEPMSIYELHLGSWRRGAGDRRPGYREIADELVPYVLDRGFTHVELMPVTEHPFDGSWGYQATGYFAPTSRFGSPDDFRYLIDACHRAGIGVILDWVPAHFPKDEFALARFDGTALYEHEDERLAEHPDWGTLIFNFGRKEVLCFLLSSANYWLDSFHVDGLRLDAVSSMLYLDYSRGPGEWVPNRYGGRENLEAIDFLRELNIITHAEAKGAITCAEESTAWPMVSRPTWLGGLGFSMKWNMGWMHDTLVYMARDPVHREYHHDNLTFSLLYAFEENFILPFSHDEVVHGKGSMLGKMPGDEWQKFANLRLLYTYQFTHPGKKLLFMGGEFAHQEEWDPDRGLDWSQSTRPANAGISDLVRDLNLLYRRSRALHARDFTEDGFEWLNASDAHQSVLSYVRKDNGNLVVVVLNFTPVPRHGYRLGVPLPGRYLEVFNSDSRYYGGSDVGNNGGVEAQEGRYMGRSWSIRLTLPPLAGLVLEHVA